MSPRIRGRSYQQTSRRSFDDRANQIRGQLQAGVTDPAAICRTMGCCKVLVLYYARRMDDVVLERVRAANGHLKVALAFAAPQSTTPPTNEATAA